MGQSKWNEEKIIQTLRNLPVVEDRQTKEELFEKIENRIDYKKKKRKSFRFMPILAAACVLFIAAIISPAILKDTVFDTNPAEIDNGNGVQNPKEDSDSVDFPEEAIPPAPETEEPVAPLLDDPKESEIEPKVYEGNNIKYHAGVGQIPEGKQVVTVYYSDQDAQGTVPVSVFVDKELPKIEALQNAMKTIDPDKLGVYKTDLQDSEKVRISEDPENNALVLDIQPGSIQGSAGDRLFLESVNSTAYRLGYEKLIFKSNGEPGYEFSHYGRTENAEVKAPEKGITSLLTGQGTLFLVEGIRSPEVEQTDTFEKVIESMKSEISGFGYDEPIQQNVFIKEVSADGDAVTIELAEGSRLVNEVIYIAMIESILLTAEQFGYEQVNINGSDITEIGPYNLEEPLPVLKAPNVVTP